LYYTQDRFFFKERFLPESNLVVIILCHGYCIMLCHISEWYWKCVLHGYVLKIAAIVAGLLSAAVVWSEVTFFNKEPLSLFAKFLNPAKVNYDYFTIEVSETQ
jgi:hypothetical protein